MYSNDRNNEGAIWKNDNRQKDTHPHFQGRAIVDGVEYWVSAWKRSEDASPKAPALKFTLTPKEPRPSHATAAPTSDAQTNEDFDNDIPF